MSERIVLAELIVDSKGVVTGVKEATDSITILGQGANRLGENTSNLGKLTDKLGDRFLSLRHAAIALLGSFTVAGLIFQVVQLGKELVQSTEAWRLFTSTMEHAWISMTKGETAIARIGLNLDKMFKGAAGAGPAEFVGKLDEIKEAMKGIKEAQEAAVGGTGNAFTGALLGPFARFFTLPPETTSQLTATMTILNLGWKQLGESVDAIAADLAKKLDITKEKARELMQQFTGILLPARPAPTERDFKAFAGLPSPEVIDNYNRLISGALNSIGREFQQGRITVRQFGDELGKVIKEAVAAGKPGEAMGIIAKGLGTLRQAFDAGKISVHEFAEQYRDLVQKAIGAGAGPAFLKQMKDVVGVINQIRFAIDDLMQSASEKFQVGALAAEIFTSAIEGMGNAIADALIGSGTSFKKALGEMMAGISRMAFVYALWNTALAIYASTVVGAATVGPPGPYVRAALEFGAVGLAAGLAARALGAGAQSSSSSAAAGGGGGVQAASATPAAPNPRRLEVNFNGPTFGFNEAAFGRWLMDLERRGARSNA